MAQVKKEVRKANADVTKALSKMTTTSGKIRYLDSLDWKQGDIKRYLNIRHQHVNNVLREAVKNPVDSMPK